MIVRNINFIEWKMYIFCLFRTALTEWCTRLIIFAILSLLYYQYLIFNSKGKTFKQMKLFYKITLSLKEHENIS